MCSNFSFNEEHEVEFDECSCDFSISQNKYFCYLIEFHLMDGNSLTKRGVRGKDGTVNNTEFVDQ